MLEKSINSSLTLCRVFSDSIKLLPAIETAKVGLNSFESFAGNALNVEILQRTWMDFLLELSPRLLYRILGKP